MHLAYPNNSIPHALRCPHTPAEMRPLFCEDCTADEVYARYKEMDFLYRMGEPVCGDEEFDRYELLCRKKFPFDERFKQVGSDLKGP